MYDLIKESLILGGKRKMLSKKDFEKASMILNQVVRKDPDFLRLEQSKKALLRDLRKRLEPEDYRRLYEIVEIMDRQLTIASSYLLQSSQ